MSEILTSEWHKSALAKQKLFKQFLDKVKISKALPLLHQYHEKAFEQIDCLSCANCCKNYSPRFKQPEIKRLAKYLGMKEGEFAQQYLHLDEDNDYVLKQHPCPFLEQNTNKCTIYEQRPSDCQRYPYTDEDVFLKRKALTLKNTTVCPIAFQVLNDLVQKTS